MARPTEHHVRQRDPAAASDLEALRAVFDSNGDGVLDASDAAFGDFKLMVTGADGSTSVMAFDRVWAIGAQRIVGQKAEHT